MNSFFFWHLTFAHFLTDYPLQTDKLFEKKTKSVLGILIHGLLLFSSMFLFLLPFSFSLNVLFGIILITILHILQDKFKVFLSYREEIGENFFYYVIDQLLHIFIIFIFSKYYSLPEVKEKGLWFEPFFFKILTFIIIVTYAYWILLYSIEYTFFKYNNLIQGKMKFWGFVERGSSFFLYFLNPFLSLIPFISTLYFIFNFKEKEVKFFYVFRSFSGIVLTILTAFLFYNFIL
ncbi:MAG: DUF3307 domain-containing protein [candidate division WOR-3 bacterium]